MDVDDLLKRLETGRRDFSWIDLAEADLSGIDLQEKTLYSATLSHANLSGANLTHINLCKAKLDGIRAVQANLTAAKLYKADLSAANLEAANLSRADLNRVNLQGANLRGANLTGANLTGANLTGAILDNALLEEVCWDEAILPDGSHYEPPPQPEAAIAPPEELIEAAPPPPEEPPPSKRILTAQEYWQSLPWATLAPLIVGYWTLSWLLALQASSPLLVLLAWGSAAIGIYTESLIWLTPAIAANIVALNLPGFYKLIAVILVGIILISTISTMLSTFWARTALRDGIWLAGLSSFWMSFCLFFFGMPGGGGLALLLLISMASMSFGIVTPLKMEAIGYSRKQILEIILGMTAIATVLGLLTWKVLDSLLTTGL